MLENPHTKAPINYLHDGGAHTCGLCMYHDDDRNPCVTCVVARTTGRDACLTTPYDLYWSAPLGIYEPDEPTCDKVRLAALEAARAEVVFLESLREKLDEQERA